VLGFDMDGAEVERILSALGFGVTATTEGWRCAVPSWRFDISIEADLLEELARIYGYDNLPVTRIKADLTAQSRSESLLPIRTVRRHLAARGYQEAITYSFVDPELQTLFDPELTPVALKNPISTDLAVMRTSLIPGLVSALAYNTKRQQHRVRLFETGLRFMPGQDGLVQTPTLAMVITGPREAESWAGDKNSVDFFDLKGDLESLMALGGDTSSLAFVSGQRDGLHPGQTAIVHSAGKAIGHIGALHPAVAEKLDVPAAVYACELNLDAVLAATIPAFHELSRYPEVRRDLAVIVDKTVPAQELLGNVRSVAGTYLTDLTLFDVYEGKGIDPKRKSLALGLTFRDQSRTLGDEDVNQAVQQVIDSLEKNYNAELRG
jgi:phenylalanyl-tRNA synthetase beta chain